MKILFSAFKGNNNSSKLLLDKIVSDHKLYLTNSFKTSVLELYDELENNNYDLIVSFGQAPLNEDTIKIETTAKGNVNYTTSFDYNYLFENLKNDYKLIVSNDAGNYLCNNIYYYGLEFIKLNNLNTKMIFIHIPKIKNITNLEKLSKNIELFLDKKGV